MMVTDVPACAVGLRDPSSHKLFGKKWSFATDAPGIAVALAGLTCDGHHQHQRVEGTSQGQMRSVITQDIPRSWSVGFCVVLRQMNNKSIGV